MPTIPGSNTPELDTVIQQRVADMMLVVEEMDREQLIRLIRSLLYNNVRDEEEFEYARKNHVSED